MWAGTLCKGEGVKRRITGLRGVVVGTTMVYAYLSGIVVFGFFTLLMPMGEPFLDWKDFLVVPMRFGLLAAGATFLGVWILIFPIWLGNKDRRYHFLLKLTVNIISSAWIFLMAAVWATFISLCAVEDSIRTPSIEWMYNAPPLSPSTGAITLCLTALACGFSVFVYSWARRVTKPAQLQIEKMIAETCGQCGYVLFRDATICPECGWRREAEA